MSSLYPLWLGALGLLLLSLAVLLPSLLRGNTAASVRTSDDTLRNLYRAQMQELAREHQAGNLSDADLARTVKECLAGSLSFNGQRCTALKILFVQRSIADDFVGRLSAEINGLQLGMPWQPGVAITPLPEPGKTAFLTDLLQDALTKGAKLQNPGGGETVASLFTPALLYPVSSTMRLYSEEQFGPLVPVVPFDDVSEVIDYVVNSNFGQQLSIFGSNAQQVGELVDIFANQVGRININSQCQRGPDSFPFNGRKDSAEGTLSVVDALRQFSTPTLVAAKYQDGDVDFVKQMVRARSSHFLSTDFLF